MTAQTHPSHPHPLQQVDPVTIYPQYDGHWRCDNCEQSFTQVVHPYHCTSCPFDLCHTCHDTKGHVRHEHPLYLTRMTTIYPRYNGAWKCDGCGDDKGPPSEPMAYHCFYDQFDLCCDCFSGHRTKVHTHPLVPADAAIVYNNSPGLWVCDICRRNGNDLGTKFSWHCSVCEFDCCTECLREVRIPAHEHPLKITDSFIVYPQYSGGWKCDMCERDKHPNMQETNVSKPYHCESCQFDACHECVNRVLGRDTNRAHDVPGPPPEVMRGHSMASTPTSTHQPHRGHHEPPVEMYEMEDDDSNGENLDDSQKCIVCMSRPKNATIVHQRTGHVCCCLRCAYTLQQRGDKCPICRAHIDTVIKHFNS